MAVNLNLKDSCNKDPWCLKFWMLVPLWLIIQIPLLCMCQKTQKFICNSFGAIEIDLVNKTFTIDKYRDNSNTDVINIANCIITDLNSERYIISSLPLNYSEYLKLKVNAGYHIPVDSVTLHIIIPKSCSDKCYLIVSPCIGKDFICNFSACGEALFKLKKHDFKFDNDFSAYLVPNVNPFKSSTSWGDNETVGFIDLEINKYIDNYDNSLSELQIDIINLTDDIFSKWVIEREIVLIKDSSIIWRNKKFIRQQ